MKKKLSLRALEKKLDKVFSIYIRRRHADAGGTVQCVTCQKRMHWEKDGAQAGHFIKRQHRSTRWRPTNCHVQCTSCNTYRGGMQDEYAKFIVHTYGLAEFDDLMESKHKVVKFTREAMEGMLAYFTLEIEGMELREAA